jgi:hypothetical protein
MSDKTRTTIVDANAAFAKWALPTVGSSQARTAYTTVVVSDRVGQLAVDWLMLTIQ